MAMVNLDTVGCLGTNKLAVLGTSSVREWVQIFTGVGHVIGVQVENVANELGSSDQKSFLDAGVPAVQLFSGPNLDYHRPTDTADKIDPDGLVKVAAVAKEIVDYLAGRAEQLTSSLGPAVGVGSAGPLPVGSLRAAKSNRLLRTPAAASAEGSGQRKVSLGMVPDFTCSGQGVKLSGVSPGSPADKAGLQQGDVIVKLSQMAIKDLRGLSNVLKSLNPGDTVKVTYTRNGREVSANARVEAR